jgi:hypothetical protein
MDIHPTDQSATIRCSHVCYANGNEKNCVTDELTSGAIAASCTPDRVREPSSFSTASAFGHGAALSSEEWIYLLETYELLGFSSRLALDSKDAAECLQQLAISTARVYASLSCSVTSLLGARNKKFAKVFFLNFTGDAPIRSRVRLHQRNFAGLHEAIVRSRRQRMCTKHFFCVYSAGRAFIRKTRAPSDQCSGGPEHYDAA